MNRKKNEDHNRLLYAVAISLIIHFVYPSLILAAQYQKITLMTDSDNLAIGSTFTLSVMYDVSDKDNSLSGIGVRIFYDSSRLSYISYKNIAPYNVSEPAEDFEFPMEDQDKDPNTDSTIVIAWADLDHGEFPGQILPCKLIDITFQVKRSATIGTTSINISFTSVDPGYEGDSNNATINIISVPTVSWTAAYQDIAEISGNIQVTAQLSYVSTEKDVVVPITVSGTAELLTDYSLSSQSILIPSGEQSASITVTVFEDYLIETNEVIVLSMGTPVNALTDTSYVHAIIIDNIYRSKQQVGYQYTSRIPDTGQTSCQDMHDEVSCKNPDGDNFGQDASYNINPESFTKLDAQGNDLPGSASEWAMVRDNVTGLVWEVKTDDQSIHDKNNTYTWFDNNPETNGGDAGTNGNGTDTNDFINSLNNSRFGGFSDWRLPTMPELGRIVNYAQFNPLINKYYFPETMPAYYWTSTSSVGISRAAWVINFGGGNDNCQNKGSSYCVRAVHGKQCLSFDNMVINYNGTVTDSCTGLMWQQDPAANTMNWQNAIKYCETLSLSDYTDWRLPTIKELKSIIDYSKYHPALNSDFFNGKIYSYWSSTSYHGIESLGVNFHYSGNTSSSYSSSTNYVRAVRGGQNQSIGSLVVWLPEQSSRWHSGDIMPIKWDTQNISGNVTILISHEGGKSNTFVPIANETSNDGEFEWTIANPPSVNCMLKILPINEPGKGTTQGLFSIINTPPVAYSETVRVNINQTYTGQFQTSDINSNSLVYTIVSYPEKGVINITNISTGEYTYTPDSNQSGLVFFEFKVNDGYDDSNISTVSIVITEVYNPPQAYTQTLNTTENMPVNITLTGVSPDNNPLTFRIIGQPSHGILSQSMPYLTYTPDDHFYGTDNFTFIANDGISDSNPETISITIERAKLKIKAISNKEIYLSQSDHITLTGTGFSDKTRVSISLDTGNQSAIIGSVDVPAYASKLKIIGNLAYVDGREGLQIIDISDLEDPKIIGAIDTPGYAFGVEIIGTTAYVASGDTNVGGSLEIIDVSDPTSPSLISSLQTTDRDYPPYGLVALDTTVYLIDHYGVKVIDVTAPSNPHLLTTIECRPSKIYLQEGLVYVNCGNELKIIDISNPSQPIIKDTITIQDCYNFKVIDSIAYCLFDHPGKLNIIDIKEKTNQVILGSVNLNCLFPSDIFIYQDKVYITAGSKLTIIDIHDPSSPILIGSIYTPYGAQGMIVKNNIAYIACDTSLQIIDVNTSSLQYSGFNSFDKIFASDVEVVNDIAYVASSNDGFNIVDISTPTYYTISCLKDIQADIVTISGTKAYVLSQNSIKVIDIENDKFPTIIGSEYCYGQKENIVISGEKAYVAAGTNGGFQIFDISNPNLPRAIGALDVDSERFGTTIVENIAYMADGENGFKIFDNTNPSIPILLSTINTPGYAKKVSIENSYAYISDGIGGVQIVDISNINSPEIVSSVDTGWAETIVLEKNIAYVAAGEEGLIVLDINDPLDPLTIGSFDTSGFAYDLTIVDNTIYVADGDSLQNIDITNPYSPVLSGSVEMNYCDARMIFVRDYFGSISSGKKFAYISSGTFNFQVFDVSDPSTPKQYGSTNTSTYVTDIDIIGTKAYVSCAYIGMKIIDISVPYNPTIIGAFDFEEYQYTNGIAIIDNIAILADQYIGLQIIDINNPSQPKVIGSLESISWAYDVIILDSIAYILSEKYIYSVDISNPSIPVIIGTVRKPGYGRNFTIVDDTAHIADYENGLVSLPLPAEIQSKNLIDETTLSINLPTSKSDGTYILRVFDDNDNYDETFIHIHQKIEKKLTIEVIENLTTNEDIPISLTFYTHNVESESENITITVTPTQPELIQNISINSISKYTHTMLIIPAEDAFGSTELDITVSDSVSTISRSLTVNVLPVNDPPMFSSFTVPVIYEDYGEKYITWADYISPGPANESDQTCTFIVHPAANDLLTSTPTISQNGILNFTTAPNAYGSVVFDVTLKDDGGTENNGIDTSSIQKFTIVVEPVNDCPIFMKGEDQIVHNRDGIQSISGWASGINQGENESNQALQFIIETDNNSIFETIPEISNDGTLIYTPAPDQTGASLITVYLQDSGGTEFSGCDTSMAQFFTITVLQTFYELTILQEGQGKIKLNDREVLPEYIQSYQADTTFTLKSIPFENWKFAYWSGDIEDSSEDIQITLDRPITIVAHFYEPPVTLNLIGKKQIKINGTIHDLPCSKQINKHTTVYLEPVPVSDFLKWSGDINSTEINVTVIMENDTHIAVHYKDPFEWETVIHAESQNLGGKFQDNITVGVSITPFTEPYLSSNYFSCAMSIYSHEMDILSKDIRQDNDLITYQWLIAINPHGNIPPFDARIAEISWDPQTFSANGIYRLERGYGSESETVISDMRLTTEFTVEGINADQYFTLIWATVEQNVFDYSLTSGWNLISLPVIPNDFHFQSIFHDATTAYEFKNGGYIISSELTCGKGYWVKIPSDKTYTITGEPFRQNTIDLSPGWHLIGVTNQEAIPSTVPESLIEAIYQYENGAYQLVESFEPGKGYWIKLSEDGEFSIGRK